MAQVNALLSHQNRFLNPHTLFTVFKYTIYLLLAYNILLWFQEDLAASAETFGDTVSWRNVVEAFSATIDTAAWVVLLLLFELETAVIPDEKLKGGLKWLFMAIRVIAYVLIVYSFWGYCVKYGLVTNNVPFSIADVCSLAGTEWNYIYLLDEYPPIDLAACTAMQGKELFQIAGTEIIATSEQLEDAIRLALIDILNAGTWLVIVVLLEVEVWLQIKELLTDRMLLIGKYIKGFFYALLFFCAIYWGFEGDFLDFWDAFLWLVAFIFIELNIFQWHGEVEQTQHLEEQAETVA
jgi:hypothetical protein